jgi:uncharacterized protein (DUF2235 family)
MAAEARSQAAFKPRNLIVLSDGTGNSAAKLFRTNVWRIYDALDLNCDDQVALYDNGVGTAAFKPLAALGGAFGFGLKRNVLDLYTFLCRNYQVAPDFDADPARPARHDRIFAFGFSRGAFTARVVAGLVANQGLICAAKSDRDLIRLARWAYRRYRADRYRNSIGVRFLRTLRNGVFRMRDMLSGQKPYDPSKNRKVDINFLGVFDTVAAYGLPVDELTKGWDKWVWPMLPRDKSLNKRVKYARHAVAIDDERQTFFPLLWDEDSEREKENNRKFLHPPTASSRCGSPACTRMSAAATPMTRCRWARSAGWPVKPPRTDCGFSHTCAGPAVRFRTNGSSGRRHARRWGIHARAWRRTTATTRGRSAASVATRIIRASGIRSLS